MNREKRKIFGQMLVDIVKYLMTIIVIGSVFAERIKWQAVFVGFALAIFLGAVAYLVLPNDKKESE